jgi:hypothetical protein
VNINTNRPVHDAIVKNIANGKQNRITQGGLMSYHASYGREETAHRNGNLIERDSDNKNFDKYIKE